MHFFAFGLFRPHCVFTMLPAFCLSCFSFPQPPLGKDSQGCFIFWILLTSFVHSISSFKLPPCLVFQPTPFFLLLLLLFFLHHPVLFTHHNGGQHNLMESWADSRQDSVWPRYSHLPITNVWLNMFSHSQTLRETVIGCSPF